MPQDIQGFKSFVLKKYPDISKSQLKQVDDFIKAKQDEKKRNIDLELELNRNLRNDLKDTNFQKVQSQIGVIRNATENKEGDLALIYGFIKMLDPDSVVREGEIKLTSQAPSIAQKFVRTYSRVAKGRLLTPSERTNFKAQSELFYANSAQQAQPILESYRKNAEEYGIDPKRVLGQYAEIKPVDISQINLEGPSQTFGEKVQAEEEEYPLAQRALAAGGGPLAALGIGTPMQKQLVPAGIAGGLIGLGIPSIVGGIAARFSPAAIGAARDIATKQAGNFNITSLLKAGEEYAKRHPEIKDTWKTVKSGLQSSAPQLVQQLSEWRPLTYTVRGATRPNLEAGLFKTLIQGGTKLIQQQAPEVAKQTKRFAQLFQAPEAIKTGLTTGLKLTALGRLLGL
ncbi:MAG: hypothetical protein AAB922_07675 [Patescibacteria group bacterium]